MKAPDGSYFITGRPRSRTAWLAALLYGEIPCSHDDIGRLNQLVECGKPFGFSSPSLVMTDPERAISLFGDTPIVVIERDSTASWRALQAWAGFDLPGWRALESNFERFMQCVPRERLLIVPVADLDDYETVNRIHLHCLNSPLCQNRFRTFDLLRIEQHRQKIAEMPSSNKHGRSA